MPDAPPEVVMIQPMPAGQPAAAGERAATDWVELARSFQALPRRPICAPANLANEIVVCARQPESERYRVPKVLRDAKKSGVASWGERAESLEYVGASGTASCSPAGAGGWTGCQSRLLSQARAERRQRKTEESEIP